RPATQLTRLTVYPAPAKANRLASDVLCRDSRSPIGSQLVCRVARVGRSDLARAGVPDHRAAGPGGRVSHRVAPRRSLPPTTAMPRTPGCDGPEPLPTRVAGISRPRRRHDQGRLTRSEVWQPRSSGPHRSIALQPRRTVPDHRGSQPGGYWLGSFAGAPI